jgi:hypothetical protein
MAYFRPLSRNVCPMAFTSLVQIEQIKIIPASSYLRLESKCRYVCVKYNAINAIIRYHRLFMNGVSMHLDNLYPAISYPVSRGTQMISPLILWDHNQDWLTCEYDEKSTETSSERRLLLNLEDEEYAYMAGHIIDGKFRIS